MDIAEKLEAIAENMQNVYDAGFEAGAAEGNECNKKVTDSITVKGTRSHFTYAFAYTDWSGYTFNSSIKPTGNMANMFYACFDMTELPAPLDFSEIMTKATSDTSAYRKDVFGYCKKLKVIPDLNMKAIGGIEEWFTNCYELHTIELLRVKAETVYNNITFAGCRALENLTIDGVIGQNNFNLKDSNKLNKKSITSVIEHLSDETAGLTVTFSKTAKEAAFTDDEWSVLEATKPNWTIALV